MKWLSYKSFSGYSQKGYSAVNRWCFNPLLHLHRAVLLTAQLEGPYWGTVQSYDGAGMSAGLFHHVAVLPNRPKTPQGSLWKLLRHMEVAAAGKGYGSVRALFEALADRSWFVSQDGQLRDTVTGALIPGEDIRTELSGPKGKVPKGDTNAIGWVRVFHDLFADPALIPAQIDFAVGWLIDGQSSAERYFYHKFGGGVQYTQQLSHLSPDFDLAMCAYHSHSVNAPGMAVKVLNRLKGRALSADDFPRALIRALGKTRYGAWLDLPGDRGRSRYDRTRLAAMKLDLWPADLFTASGIMPKDLL